MPTKDDAIKVCFHDMELTLGKNTLKNVYQNNTNKKLPVINMQKTGANIKKLRERNEISVRELKNIFGFSSHNSIYKWEHGKSLPTVDNLIVLATVFQVTIDEILVVDY